MTPASQPYRATPVATADRPGPWPGVVVIHDILGRGDDMLEQADWFAAAGYLAVVPDLFGGRSAIRCIKGAIAQLTAQRGPMFDGIEAARADLAAAPDCTGRVGVIGYCLGGGFALLVAGRPGFGAASVNYGQLPANLEEVLAGACPVVASFGAKDRSLPGATATLRAAATAVGAVVEVKEYPNARHAFINREVIASPLSPLLKVAGIGYDHDSAADAKRRILAFFEHHLRAPAA